MKKLAQLGAYLSKAMVAWDPIYHSAWANPGSYFDADRSSNSLTSTNADDRLLRSLVSRH